MEIPNLSQINTQLLQNLAKKHDMSLMAIFGSYMRNEQKSESDLDLLVEFHHPPSLVRFIIIEEEISDAINVKIDLVTLNSLNKNIKTQILAEMQVVWDERS